MPDARLPIKVKRIPGGFTVDLADGRKLWIYGREPEIAKQANAMTLDEAEQLAKDVARALTEAWSETMTKRDELLRLNDLADGKGYDVTQSMVRDHVRLIDSVGNFVKNKNGGAAFTYTEARRYMEGLPDRKG